MQIDDEMDRHCELLKEIQDSPTDINAIITRRRKDFTDEFFHHLNLVSETCDSLEDRDGKYYALPLQTQLFLWLKSGCFKLIKSGNVFKN